jgi:hypothetical protein
MSELAFVAGAVTKSAMTAMLSTRMIFIFCPSSTALIRIYLPTSLDLVSTPGWD